MGFHDGWSKAADQLEELAKGLPRETEARVAPANPGDGHEVVPHLVCAGAANAIAFYTKAFGATEMIRLPTPDGALYHASVGTPVTIHLSVTDAKGVVDRAVKAGATLVMPVERQFWGDLYGIVEDPFGHRWSIATPGENAPRTTEALTAAMPL